MRLGHIGETRLPKGRVGQLGILTLMSLPSHKERNMGDKSRNLTQERHEAEDAALAARSDVAPVNQYRALTVRDLMRQLELLPSDLVVLTTCCQGFCGHVIHGDVSIDEYEDTDVGGSIARYVTLSASGAYLSPVYDYADDEDDDDEATD